MALIDPPEYVAVPSRLIYGADDLERELYKALLQVIGWMWVTKRHGKDLITGIGELGARWGVAERTVYDRLKRLQGLGYLRVRYGQGGRVYLGANNKRQQTTTDKDERQQTGVGGGGSCKQLARDGPVGASSLHGHASSLHEIGVGVTSKVCGSILIDPPHGHTTTTTAEELERGESGGQVGGSGSVYERLVELGVHPGRARDLAADEWVTMARLEGWVADFVRQGSVIRSVPAVLAKNLGDRWEPPQGGELGELTAEDRRERYCVEGAVW